MPDRSTEDLQNEMIERDRASWEAQLQDIARQNGVPYDPSDVEGVVRQVSYARNAGVDPQQFIDSQRNIYAQRAQPSASNGGSGGDADVDGNGQIDAGWLQNTPGKGRAWLPEDQAHLVGAGRNGGNGYQLAGGGDVGMDETTGQVTDRGQFNLAMPTGFGEPPQPFGESYTTPERPAWLQGEYVVPEWTGGDFTGPVKPLSLQSEFQPPTMAEVQASPGYQTRLDAGRQMRERGAAAQGSILNGGTQKALARYGQDYAANEYGAETARRLGQRQQTAGEYQTDYGNAFQSYQQRYGQFSDQRNAGLAARQVNEGTYQGDVANSRNQYGTRYQAYLDLNQNRRQSENDYWSRNQDLIGNSLTAAGLARP